MKLQELNSKARRKAGDTVLEMMKDHRDQYLSVEASKVEKFADDNNLNFDSMGNLQK